LYDTKLLTEERFETELAVADVLGGTAAVMARKGHGCVHVTLNLKESQSADMCSAELMGILKNGHVPISVPY
jgi:hypothetical protein